MQNRAHAAAETLRLAGLLGTIALAGGALWGLAASSGCAPPRAPDATAGARPPGPATPTGGGLNPFAGARMFVNPDYLNMVSEARPTAPGDGARYAAVGRASVATWLDSIAKVPVVGRHLAAATQQARGSAEPIVVTFVVYDLPGRDCAAKSSAGELTADAAGEARYRAEYIDRIASELRKFPDVRVAAIVEPDSLANIATNLAVPACKASEAIYQRSIAYAVRALALPNVSLYLDAAHAGWLGWSANRAKIAAIYKSVLTEAGGVDRIRGFATNVSNYNVVRGDDGHRLEPSDPCPDELTYVEKLSASLAEVGITGKGFIIDTSRNGRPGIRAKWAHWCNVKGAGLGPRPQASPAPLVDAYYWVKPPGESDGTSNPKAERYDATCSSPDSALSAPEAGQWFESYFADLVKNADPPL